jgi:hypothetical protein
VVVGLVWAWDGDVRAAKNAAARGRSLVVSFILFNV